MTAVGRYETVATLATGGMAEILLGRLVGPSGFERPVVIKRILRHLARQQAFVKMFLDDARIIATIRHPNVVHVQELGQQDGELYLVMEYLEGETLSALVRRLVARGEALDFGLAAHILAEACAGLNAAHELRIVHRDVSPQNVFITYDGHVKVIDFGIAKSADSIARTEAGQLKGKLEYMSPEQCRGEGVDPRSDTFSVGIVLYELTTKRRLFAFNGALRTINAICSERTLPPSRVCAGYPAVLESIVLKALAKKKEERYATAGDLRRDLSLTVRELCTDVPEETLAATMRRVFEDRIGEKRTLLSRVHAGVRITSVPSQEPEEPLPDHQETVLDHAANPDEAAPGAASAPPRRSGTPRVVVALTGLALLVMGGFALAHRAGPATPVVAPSAWANSSPVVPSALPIARLPLPTDEAERTEATEARHATQEYVRIRIDSNPKGDVLVDGAPYGPTPVDLELPKSDRATTLEVRRPGFATVRRTVTPREAQAIMIALTEARRAPRRHRLVTPDAGGPPVASSAPARDFHRFE